MQGMVRRPSGVYVARLVVPLHLRAIVGKREFLQSTGSRELAVAKVVATHLLAGWRRVLHDLRDRAAMDILQLTTGSPKLHLGGLLPLHEASVACGLAPADLVRAAAQGAIGLFIDPGVRPGFFVQLRDLDYDPKSDGYDIPPPELMPSNAVAVDHPGAVQINPREVKLLLAELIDGQDCKLLTFMPPGRPQVAYCPAGGLPVNVRSLQVRGSEVEAVRARLALKITPEQLAAAQREPRSGAAGAKGHLTLTAAIDAFIDERSRRCAPDQARRIRAACELFVHLMGDMPVQAITRDMLRLYRDKKLPLVPANENKIRLMHGTTSITLSMEKVAGTAWPRISPGEVAKRMQWLCGLFEWLHQEKWIADDPAIGLGTTVRPRRAQAANQAREQFTREDLTKIFSAAWFQQGKGQRTRSGTYREFLPFYYWLPLLGLYYGARINEICQLGLSDIRQTQTGTWYIDITQDSDDEGAKKRVKNVNSIRRVPLHPHLVKLGLLQWRSTLQRAGHSRLFPELLYSERKGHSAAAVKWFSSHLKRLGWPRTGKKVFHSFRHTAASECLNVLGLSEQVTAQISGHQRGTSVLMERYRKDAAIDELAPEVARLDFDLPAITPFDCTEGLAALRDALRRKRDARANQDGSDVSRARLHL